MNYAGIWRRFFAVFIDGLILGISFNIGSIIITSMLTVFFSPILKTEEDATLFAVFAYLIIGFLGVFVQWLYYALMESSSKQATLGQRAMGIYVTDLNGNRISFGKATGRYLGKVISALTLGIGYLMAGFTEKKQALHDMMAGCLVVRKATRNSTQQAANTPVYHGQTSKFSINLSSGQTIYLTVGMKLTETDIPGLKSNSFDGAVVEVNCNPNDPTTLGLKNLSHQSWTAITASSETRQIDSGRSIKLAVGTRINFGYVTGEIRYE